jgi:hypothetical protein
LLVKAAAGAALAFAFGGAWYARAHGWTTIDMRFALEKKSEPRFTWTSVDKKHWQVVSATPVEKVDATDTREGNNAGCPGGMVRVKGKHRQGDVESAQDAACTDWISRDFPARCRTFDPEKVASEVQKLPARAMDYCIDRFEYPNQIGQNPIIVVTWHEADAMCTKAQKRLCTETEWTFACEGEEARPYPYGYTRDATACVVDRNWRPFAEGALQPRDGQQAREELDRLWQAEPSGSRGGCKSAFGVYDMTGNVDEWTRSVRSTGFRSVLKGGYWGPVRARCRPSTRAHDEDFVAYQQGFRCCADSDLTVPAPNPKTAAALAHLDAPPIDTSSKAASDLPETVRSTPFEDRDEVDAIKKARVGFSCTTSPSSSSPIAIVFVFAALVSTRRRAALRDRASSAPLRRRDRVR